MASSVTIPVSALMTSDRNKSGTVVSARVPWMLRSSDMLFALVLAYPRRSAPVLLPRFTLVLAEGRGQRAEGRGGAAHAPSPTSQDQPFSCGTRTEPSGPVKNSRAAERPH